LEIDADQDTILTVKRQIQQQTGILPENQILKFDQTVLNDDQKTLRDYGIVIDESSIDLTSPGNEAAVDEDDIFDIDEEDTRSSSLHHRGPFTSNLHRGNYFRYNKSQGQDFPTIKRRYSHPARYPDRPSVSV
jgi:hypothetical protein